MIFAVFAILSFIVLRLTLRLRWRPVIVASLVIGVVADYATDFLVILQR